MGNIGMTLQTTRTICRPLSSDDFDVILEMYLEPDSNKFIAPLRDKSVEYYTTFLNKKIESNKTQVGFWVIYHLESGAFIGTANLNQFGDTTIMHLGGHLKKSFWGMGYAYEVLSAIRDHGFTNYKLTEIYGIVEVGNAVSKSLMKKLGFIQKEIRTFKGDDLIFYQYQEMRSK